MLKLGLISSPSDSGVHYHATGRHNYVFSSLVMQRAPTPKLGSIGYFWVIYSAAYLPRPLGCKLGPSFFFAAVPFYT